MMKNEINDSMRDANLTPTDYITLMFERTDENGVLYIPDWGENLFQEEDHSYKCRVDWNLEKYERLLGKFNQLYAAIQKIAPFHKELDAAPQNAKAVLKDAELFDVWCTYLRPFDKADFDDKLIRDIDDRYDTMELVQDIAKRISKGEPVSESNRHWLTEYLDVTVTKEEEEYYERYVQAIYKDAKSRVKRNICAYDVIIRAMRVCRLIHLGAPEVIVNNEARILAAAMMMNEYGISKETVGDSVRLHIERLEQMSEEELDEYYKPKKTNSRKSLAPLFVYSILQSKSNSKKHLRQQEILEELSKYPYEITIERKALSRLIHNLVETSPYAIFSDKSGVWIEQEKNDT